MTSNFAPPTRRCRAFVAASAGSGKTKLLTDRLLRLMLAGADPARIQCLTFTKAAAAEMALRLQRTLGAWVTLDDADLDEKLAESAARAERRACATPRGRCSPACSTCPAACASAPSTPSASRCCGASRWRRGCRRISAWSTTSMPTAALRDAREDMLAGAAYAAIAAGVARPRRPRLGRSVRPSGGDAATRPRQVGGGVGAGAGGAGTGAGRRPRRAWRRCLAARARGALAAPGRACRRRCGWWPPRARRR